MKACTDCHQPADRLTEGRCDACYLISLHLEQHDDYHDEQPEDDCPACQAER